MDKTEKLALIARFESAVDPLIELVKDAPPAAIDYRPNLPEAWTIREHAVHFLDADTFAHGRLRLAVAEPGTEVLVWNEVAFQQRGEYRSGDALASLDPRARYAGLPPAWAEPSRTRIGSPTTSVIPCGDA